VQQSTSVRNFPEAMWTSAMHVQQLELGEARKNSARQCSGHVCLLRKICEANFLVKEIQLAESLLQDLIDRGGERELRVLCA
jgi:hypothetical protein